MQNKNNGNRTKIRSGSLSLLILLCFIPICVLYYFIRFQFGLDREVLAAYSIFQILILSAVILVFVKWFFVRHRTNAIDWLLLILTLHALYLFVITVVRSPSYEAMLYSIKDFIFPVAVYWYCRHFIRDDEWMLVYKVIAIVLTIVSVIYVTEFFDRIILGNAPFAYTEKMRELTMEKTGATELSGTVIQGDSFTLIRFEGPLSHNNVTGLGMALGALVCLVLWAALVKNIYFLLMLINLLGLLLAAPRTAIFSLLVSAGVYLWSNKSKSRGKGHMVHIVVTIFGILVGASFFLVDFSAYSTLYNFNSLYNTMLMMLTANQEVSAVLESFYNPIGWLGLGYPVPGDFSRDFNVIRSDDLFFIQLISMYGLIGALLLFFGGRVMYKNIMLVRSKRATVMRPVFYLSSVVIIAMVLSTIHTNALIRPQLFPLFFISLAAFAAYLDNKKFSHSGHSANSLQ